MNGTPEEDGWEGEGGAIAKAATAVAPKLPEPQQPHEREPAERKVMHFKGDQVEACHRRHYFGPNTQGRVWKIRYAEYDADKDVTTAWFAPVSEHELNAVIQHIQRQMGQ